MTPELFKRVEDLFDATKSLGTVERAVFLEGCDDPLVRQEVADLLSQHEKVIGEGFLRPPPSEVSNNRPTGEANFVGSRVGPYEVLALIDSGGMGSVYRAARTVGFHQVVALKQMKLGLDGEEMLARFETERQVLASLHHPHIARIFDGGTADGRPYYVMEYIDGKPIDCHCDDNQLPLRERLELLRLTCLAIQFAHDRAIIHRDLKPRNIMIDSVGAPKVLDFGLAKQLDGDPTRTQTATGMAMGTPSYMAPEQVTGDASRTGPRTDVYGLGAVLYELLTGRPPFKGDSQIDTLEQVRTAEPTPPGHLRPKLPRDVGTICLKCLQKDPGRRYPSAAALADDLGRFLDGRPISARPVTRLERAYRWSRRNPWVAGLASALVLALLGGLVISTSQWQRAEKNSDQANLARNAANRRFRLAIEGVNMFYTGVSQDVLLKEERLKNLRKKLLQSAAESYRKLRIDLESSPGDDEEQLGALAEVSYGLAEITAEIGSKEDALREHQQVLDTRERLVRADPTNVQYRRDVALSYSGIGRLQLLLGHPDQAIRFNQSALTFLDLLAHNDPDDISLKRHRARSFLNMGAAQSVKSPLVETLHSYQEAIAILKAILVEHPEDTESLNTLAKSYFNIGMLQSRSGQLDAALRSYHQAREIIEHSTQFASVDGLIETLGASYNSIGIIDKYQGRIDRARRYLEQARSYRMHLVVEHPTFAVKWTPKSRPLNSIS